MVYIVNNQQKIKHLINNMYNIINKCMQIQIILKKVNYILMYYIKMNKKHKLLYN